MYTNGCDRVPNREGRPDLGCGILRAGCCYRHMGSRLTDSQHPSLLRYSQTLVHRYPLPAHLERARKPHNPNALIKFVFPLIFNHSFKAIIPFSIPW